VITFWFFRYLETERGYSSDQVFVTMAVAVLVLALGYPLAGALGDALFKRTPRGRVIVAATGVILGTVGLVVSMNVPFENTALFGILLTITALFIPFAAPNVTSTVFDISLPEVRSTATAVQYLLESIGAAFTPLIAGAIAVNLSLHQAILYICTLTWSVCAVFFIILIFIIPKDIARLRAELAHRAAAETRASMPPMSEALESTH
jgi:MFS family permease